MDGEETNSIVAWAPPTRPWSSQYPRYQGSFNTLGMRKGRARRSLVSRSGSSMRKSFAHCEAFGLTPFPSPSIPPFQDAARSAREGLSAGTGRPGRRHSRQWRGGPPLPAPRCAQRGASVAAGCCARVRGGGGGRARPFGMLPWRGREAARRDHQPQSVGELMTRDTRSMLNMPTLREMNRHTWGRGRSPDSRIDLLLFLRRPFSAAC
jgi:hypothetical protein